MTLIDFLKYLSGPGVNAAVQFLLSFALEYVFGWDTSGLDPRNKVRLTLAFSLAIPLGAAFALYGPAIGQEQAWQAIQAGFVGFLGSQGGHAVIKELIEPVKAAMAAGQTP